MENTSFKLKLKHTFVKQPCDMSQLNVKAAIITAASKMAINSDIANEEQTITELMDLLGINEEQIGQLIGMNPNYVKSIIGYSVDFMDYGSAKVNYDANKSDYNDVYNEVAERNLKRCMGKQM